MNICHYCQETEINICVKGGKLIKGLVKRYYSLDRNIRQGSLAQGEWWWQKALVEVFLIITLQFSQEQRFKKTWRFTVLIAWTVLFFFLTSFLKQAVNTFDFTLASFLQWSTNQCVLLCTYKSSSRQTSGGCARENQLFLKCWQAGGIVPQNSTREEKTPDC